MYSGRSIDGLAVLPSHVDGVPRVVGVRVGEQTIDADLVVDASGRRSRIVSWLAAVGASPPLDESVECGVIYYSRHLLCDRLIKFPMLRQDRRSRARSRSARSSAFNRSGARSSRIATDNDVQ
jgi:hypothetical protein